MKLYTPELDHYASVPEKVRIEQNVTATVHVMDQEGKMYRQPVVVRSWCPNLEQPPHWNFAIGGDVHVHCSTAHLQSRENTSSTLLLTTFPFQEACSSLKFVTVALMVSYNGTM